MNLKKILLSLTFFLLPLILGAQELKFAFLTDLHYSEGSQSITDLRQCIKDVNNLEGLDFVLFGGDLTDFGSDEEIAAVKNILDSLKYKYYVVAGNHDAKWSESGCNTFKMVFGYENFEFERKGWRFIGCNCGPDMRMAPALIPQESMEWLRSLKPGTKTIFINHYPQDTSVLNYFDVTRELKRIGTQFVIGGHWHRNVAMNYSGLPGILGRSSLSAGKAPGYNLITIDDSHVKVSEMRVFGDMHVQLEPWYQADLKPVADTVTYDANGLPSDYPWMRYDVNDGSVQEAWKIQEKANIASGFAVNDKYAFYATESGMVKCVSLKDGKQKWAKRFPGKIFSTPALDGKILAFGCADGGIYALNAKNGRLKWKHEAKKSVLGSPEIRNGIVYIGSSDGVFRALNVKNGKSVWEYAGVDGFVECKPFVDGQQVVFGTWANKLYSLDPSTGSLQWVWRCAKPSRMYSPAAVWPVKAEGKIFIAVPDRRLYVIDASSGKEIKHFDGIARESVGISQDGSTVYCKSMWHTLTSIDAKSLNIKWQAETGTGYDISPTSIAQWGGIGVVMPTDKGNIVCFDSQTGRRKWAHKISIALVNPMTTTREGHLLASTMDGTVILMKINQLY
ncbi:MAG: PQQ-binding-like beta-propeller repeat protein [Bacteroidales bacterium]|jgi:outer membrane protein assembly factor BamB/calcineurin-like phosphoesterase family protein|nr:PQQ-binding-like beta-propeller repeat protein [Bacteroidales bacterium]MCI2134681.1 PQQ-binding-like beta-propeller repeat protein [Bacteroidales bacterium]